MRKERKEKQMWIKFLLCLKEEFVKKVNIMN